jgi:hypothetical protein
MSQNNPSNQLVVGIEEVKAEEVGRDLLRTVMMKKSRIVRQEKRAKALKKLPRVRHFNLCSNNSNLSRLNTKD